MGKEISRIRLNRLYSESNIFEEISFHDGVNIILGEKYDDSSVKGRKTNGVGKSMSIEFLDFGFLNDYEKSRIAKNTERSISVRRKRNIRSGYRGRSDHDKKKPETSGSACNHKRRENGIF